MCVDTANCSGTCSECIQDKVRRLTMANTQLTKMCDQYLAELATERQRVKVLIDAAGAVVARWESPDWSDGTHTRDYIHRLRDALAAAEGAKT